MSDTGRLTMKQITDVEYCNGVNVESTHEQWVWDGAAIATVHEDQFVSLWEQTRSGRVPFRVKVLGVDEAANMITVQRIDPVLLGEYELCDVDPVHFGSYRMTQHEPYLVDITAQMIEQEPPTYIFRERGHPDERYKLPRGAICVER